MCVRAVPAIQQMAYRLFCLGTVLRLYGLLNFSVMLTICIYNAEIKLPTYLPTDMER